MADEMTMQELQIQVLKRQDEMAQQAMEFLRRAIDLTVMEQQRLMPKEDEAPDPAKKAEDERARKHHYIRIFAAQAMTAHNPSKSVDMAYELWDLLETKFAGENVD